MAPNSYTNENSSQQENAIPHTFMSFPAAFPYNKIYCIGRAEKSTGQLPNRFYKSKLLQSAHGNLPGDKCVTQKTKPRAVRANNSSLHVVGGSSIAISTLIFYRSPNKLKMYF